MPRNLKKRGRIWHYRIQKNGLPFEGSLETENLGVAQERLGEIRAKLKAAKWGDTPRRTFNEMVEKFGKEHSQNLKPATRQRYAASIGTLPEDPNTAHIGDTGSARLGDFEGRRKAQGVTSATIRRDLACLSIMYSLANAWEWVKTNPAKSYILLRSQTKALPNSVPRERHLDQGEEVEVLEYAPTKAKVSITFAIDTGLRKAEQFSLLRSDLNFPKREIRVRAENSKTGKARIIPMLPRVYQLLKNLPIDMRSPYVFVTNAGKPYSPNSPYYYEALQTAVRRANKAREAAGRLPMEHVEWHALRRTCGCRLLQDRGFSMEHVSKWLGHASIKVTERHYAFLKIEHLHSAVAKSEARVLELHGRGL